MCPAPLDRAHDFGIESDASVESEIPPVGYAQPDAAFPAGHEVLDEPASCVDRVGRQPERASEDVRVAARQCGERRQVAGVCWRQRLG